ncbi:MAG: hypothetical protein ACFFB0_16875 [Promethearchaeota archaeon]
MTNLLEKSLLLGFGIFTLTIFFSLVIPFLDHLSEFNKSNNNDLEPYLFFIDEIDKAVQFIIQNPDEDYLREVYYPCKTNLTINEYYIIFDFIIKNEIYNKVLVYNTSFYKKSFKNIPSKLYLLNVSYSSSSIILNFINLH